MLTRQLPTFVCLAIAMPVLALAAPPTGADKPLIPLKKGRWVDVATVVTPRDATGGKWIIKGKALAVDTRDELSMVYMPMPLRPLGSYEMYTAVTTEDPGTTMTIQLPIGKDMTHITFNSTTMIIGDGVTGPLKLTPRKMYTMVVKYDSKKGELFVDIDDYYFHVATERGSTTDAGNTRMRAGAKGGRATFHNMKVRSME